MFRISQALYEAFIQVKRNKGAAGIDRQSLSAFEVNLDEELSCLLLELKEKRYSAYRRFGTESYSKRYAAYWNHYSTRSFIHRATVIEKGVDAITRSARRVFSFAAIVGSGLSIWTCPNVLTPLTMR